MWKLAKEKDYTDSVECYIFGYGATGVEVEGWYNINTKFALMIMSKSKPKILVFNETNTKTLKLSTSKIIN